MTSPLPAGHAAAIVPQGRPAPTAPAPRPILGEAPAQARSDAHLLDLWLFGKSPHTRRAYRRVAGAFLATLGPGGLRLATLGDLQAWAGALPGKASSRAVTLAAVKSLLTFGHRVGYLPVNVGAALPLPKAKDDLAARILDREATFRLLDRAATPRDRALLRLLYAGGLRVSEAVALSWRDLQPRQGGGRDSGQVTVYGKGGKTRVVLLPASVWRELRALRAALPEAGDEAPVFVSRLGRRLEVSAARRVVYAAARRAGLPTGKGGVSPHWLRHAHATHAMEQGGAGVHLVKATLGHASVATTSKYLHARPDDSSALHLGL
jgi:integrase/recombinase XerD